MGHKQTSYGRAFQTSYSEQAINQDNLLLMFSQRPGEIQMDERNLAGLQ